MRTASLCLALAACSTGPRPENPDEIPLVVAQRCPGDPDCPDRGDGRLYAGAAKRDVTPLVEPFSDDNGNGKRDDGESFTDLNGNGAFDPVYLAGYGNGRLATGVHDPVWVRAWVLRYNQTTVAFYSVDAVGLFYDEVKAVRALLDPALGVDLVVSSATHVHESADTIGGWGPDEGTSGVDPGYLVRLRQACAEAIVEAVGKLRPATLTAGSIPVIGPDGDETPFISDTRDPVIIDNRMHVLQFDGADDGKPIVTVVNWAGHPEGTGPANHLVTSDYVHFLRDELEKGSGDDVVFVPGALGGQIGPWAIRPVGDDGVQLAERAWGFPFSEAWGRSVGRFAWKALDAQKGGDVVRDPAPRLSFRTTRLDVHVDNLRYLVAGQIGVFARKYFGYDKKKPLLGENAPLVDTEMAYIQLGDHLSILTMPGELLPELFIGGYDGTDAYNYRFFDATQANPPDPARAPAPPYLRELMHGDPGHRLLFGLSFDFLGYIVPRYNWAVDPTAPYLKQADGDHYEETNSLGPRAVPELVGTARQLILDKKP